MGKINTHSWHKLIQENIDWLKKQKYSLERQHIIAILEDIKTKNAVEYEDFYNAG